MKCQVKVGDLVVSTAGRDKGEYFIIVRLQENFAFLVDGKIRKVNSPKKKSIKHLKVLPAKTSLIAERIQKGEIIGNLTMRRQINSQKQKLQED